MSLLKYIMSPFVEFKEDQPSSSEANEIEKKPVDDSNSTEVETPATTSSAEPSRGPSASAAASIPQYEKHFEDLIDEANAKNPLFQGTDFKEFIDSKIDVEAITDEGTRYKTAFNVLKRTGLSKERLVTTGSEYISIIERDLNGFENAFAIQYKNDVQQKETLLQKKTEELRALNEKISSLNEEIKKTSKEIVQSKDHLNSKRESFSLAGKKKIKEIREELEKINQYF